MEQLEQQNKNLVIENELLKARIVMLENGYMSLENKLAHVLREKVELETALIEIHDGTEKKTENK